MSFQENKNKTSRFMTYLVEYQQRILAVILYLMPNKVDANDVLQETLSEMWNKFDSFEEGTSFLAWGIKIAKYKVMTFQRKNYNSKLCFSSSTLEMLDEEVQVGQNNYDDQLEMLNSCLKKLSVKEREYLNLRYAKNMTFKKIAERFNISIQGIFKAVSGIQARLLICIQSKMRNEELL